MTATNHALTGAIIGLTIHHPVSAISLAVVSHFLLDIIPHFGYGKQQDEKLISNNFRNYLIVEAILCFLIVIVVLVIRPEYWLLAVICAFAAASPDLFSYNRYRTIRAGKIYKPNAYSKFASSIQWFERPIGAVVEIFWALGAIFILAYLLQI